MNHKTNAPSHDHLYPVVTQLLQGLAQGSHESFTQESFAQGSAQGSFGHGHSGALGHSSTHEGIQSNFLGGQGD
jgi:hypothetical protein